MSHRKRVSVAAPSPPAGTSPRKWWLGIVATLALGGALAGGLWWYLQPGLEPLPALPLERLEPEVVAVIRAGANNLDKNPRSAMAWGQLGTILRVHGLEREADVCFRNAERLDPTDYRWPYLLAISLKNEDAEKSLAALRRSVAICGPRPHVQLRLAETYLERRDLASAGQIIDEVLGYEPTDSRAQFDKTRLLMAEGNLPAAVIWAERSVAGAPDKRAPRLLLAQLYRRLGKGEEEAKELEVLAMMPDGPTQWDDPDVTQVLSQRRDRVQQMADAGALAASGQIRQATSILTELANEDDGSGATTLQLAKTLIQAKKFKEAEDAIRRVLPRHPAAERLHFELGVACFLQNKHREAAEEFQKVVDLKPDDVNGFYNLGHALMQLGRKEEAKEAFAAAVRLQPSHAFARTNLADLLLEAGHKVEAREHLEIAVKLAPRDQRARDLLARSKEP